MQFGLFSNGERSNRIASISWDEDLEEVRLADKLGFAEAWIAEHPGGNRVDAQPCADLFIIKAAALTKRLHFGPAIRPLPFYHPAQVATEAAVCDHLTGGRYMAGFGGGLGGPGGLKSRGINIQTRDESKAMMLEAIDFILKCWAESEPFDWDGRFWHAERVKTQPKPLQQPRMLVGVAVSQSTSTAELAGRLGFLPLHSFHDVAPNLREFHKAFLTAAKAAGRRPSRNDIRLCKYVHVSDSVKKAKEEIRDSMVPHIERRKRDFAWQFNRCMPPSGKIEDVTFDYLVDSGIYLLGDPETVAQHIKDLYRDVGGFGTLLLIAGKDIGSRQQRARSMRLFMQHVAPRVVDLDPDRDGELEAVF